MKQTAKLVLVALTGFALGAEAIERLHAQAGKGPGCAVAEIEVADQPAYQAYLARP
jgi:hypothetical protein